MLPRSNPRGARRAKAAALVPDEGKDGEVGNERAAVELADGAAGAAAARGRRRAAGREPRGRGRPLGPGLGARTLRARRTGKGPRRTGWSTEDGLRAAAPHVAGAGAYSTSGIARAPWSRRGRVVDELRGRRAAAM